MDRSWMRLGRGETEYIRGIIGFLKFVRENSPAGRQGHSCPCIRCLNRNVLPLKELEKHLWKYGICRTYTNWTYHGEERHVEVAWQAPIYHAETSSASNLLGEPVMNMLNDVFQIPYAGGSGYEHDRNVGHDVVEAPETARDDMFGASASAAEIVQDVQARELDRYKKLVQLVKTPLYPGSKHTVMSILLKHMVIKHKRGKTNVCLDDDLQLMKYVLPEGNSCPGSYNEVKSILRDLGLEEVNIHACVNNCILYYKEHANANECPVCNEPRYKPHKKSKTIPRKVLRYFPVGPRLQRMYMSSKTAKHMRWHGRAQGGDEEGEVLTHPRNGEAWKHFDRYFSDFASDCRNVRLGLATDGFSPTGDMSNPYTIWPVIVFPYNLPPNMCMKKEYNFLTLLIPGPNSPGKCLDVYMRPLIDELKVLWENGLATYDRHGGDCFFMRAAVMWTISDFPAYGMLSGQQTKGYHACPVCMDDVNSSRHGSKICYLGHRRWLHQNHQWRFDAEAFDGTEEHMPKPTGRSGDWIADKLAQHYFGVLSSCKMVTNLNPPIPDEFKCWTHHSIFFELPYWSKLLIRHCLDVMHIEKNVCDNVLGTVLDLKYKNKDTVKARVDLKRMGIRRNLWLQERRGRTFMPQAGYTIRSSQKESVFSYLEQVRYPIGYAGNISRCVRSRDNSLMGMKTHDCHVLLQRVFPVVIRPYLQPQVVDVLIALSRFFQRICAKELGSSDVRALEEDIVFILCKLERIFPPTFFDIMIHLMIHLPEQLMLTGPVQYTWCYPNERQLMDYKNANRNKKHPEGSIKQWYLLQETMAFCESYLDEENDVEASSSSGPNFTLSVVSDDVHAFGNLTNMWNMTIQDVNDAHWCVIINCDETEAYRAHHLTHFSRNNHEHHKSRFPNVLLECMMNQYVNFPEMYNRELHWLAGGPLRHNVRAGCFVNGVKFVTTERDAGHVTQNNGVMAEFGGCTYYGILLSVIQLFYSGDMEVVLFKCKWYNTNPRQRGRPTMHTDRYGLLSIDTNSSWYEHEPYILATAAKQVFYLDDPCKGEGWKVVQLISHRNIWSASTLGEDDDEIGTTSNRPRPVVQPIEPYQEDTPLIGHDGEDIRAMVEHIHVVVDSIEVNVGRVDDGDQGFIDDEEEEIPTPVGSEESEEADDSDDSDYV